MNTLNLNPKQTFFFWKGRVALYTILKAMGIGEGDEVIIPGYTCVVVANAVFYLGATPIYADIDPLTYNITPESIEPLITPRSKAIIAQNTFGLSPDLDPIMVLAKKYGLYVIEDCAHGLGSTYKGRPAGTNTHAAFFSTQWSKPIATGLGGIAYIMDDELLPNMATLMADLKQPSRLADINLAIQRFVRPLADNPHLYYALIQIYRLLTQKLNISIGSSVGGELQTTNMPDHYLLAMGKMQHKSLLKTANTLSARIQRRQKVAEKYDGFFRENGTKPVYRPPYAEHAMLRYTIRVEDKPAIFQKAKDLHIPIGDWFISPLHPVDKDLHQWKYQKGQCPQAEKACKEGVNLLTEQEVPSYQLRNLFS